MKPIFFLFSFFALLGNMQAQQPVLKPDSKTAGDEAKNREKLRKMMEVDANAPAAKFVKPQVLHFPLRIGIITNKEKPQYPTEAQLNTTIARLNKGFQRAYMQFHIALVDTIFSDYTLESLSDDGYMPYINMSRQLDLKDTISLFLLDYNPNFCKVTENSVSCGRQAGFSYILSQETNNIVMSKFDLDDHKVVTHEFGHFFGLYHTFEEKFGRELPNGEKCETTGDLLCDTPADPGSVYEIYVNHSTCDMINNYHEKSDAYYKPLISNYMAYYKPCYMREFTFTQGQNRLLFLSSHSDLRRHFAEAPPPPAIPAATASETVVKPNTTTTTTVNPNTEQPKAKPKN
jgi:Pregnancy-associated plasma protein-A